jgi:hypothetical protein
VGTDVVQLMTAVLPLPGDTVIPEITGKLIAVVVKLEIVEYPVTPLVPVDCATK